jgi:hypothetical protein
VLAGDEPFDEQSMLDEPESAPTPEPAREPVLA